jgi:F-type H+-transporting ATPase subunit gamma
LSDTTESLRRNINSANDLQSVVRTMKALAASNIGQYEKAEHVLGDYYRSIELGLSIFFRDGELVAEDMQRSGEESVSAVVFGSDQGLVGPFNDAVADFALNTFAALPRTPRVWAVGERAQARLVESGFQVSGIFTVPNSVAAITPLVAQILIQSETLDTQGRGLGLHLFYNRPTSASAYAPVGQRLLPLDETWRRNLASMTWPTTDLPEVMGGGTATLRALIREYLFVSIFRACAESLASENASRLAAMQRADKNIDELLDELTGRFQLLRQSRIDEELFDVTSGFEALSK